MCLTSVKIHNKTVHLHWEVRESDKYITQTSLIGNSHWVEDSPEFRICCFARRSATPALENYSHISITNVPSESQVPFPRENYQELVFLTAQNIGDITPGRPDVSTDMLRQLTFELNPFTQRGSSHTHMNWKTTFSYLRNAQQHKIASTLART